MDVIFAINGKEFNRRNNVILSDSQIPKKDDVLDGSIIYGIYYPSGIESYKVLSINKFLGYLIVIDIEKIS